jgi:hypothetical protein
MSQNPQQAQIKRQLDQRFPNKETAVKERDDGKIVVGVRDPDSGEVQTREIDRSNLQSQRSTVQGSGSGAADPERGNVSAGGRETRIDRGPTGGGSPGGEPEPSNGNRSNGGQSGGGDDGPVRAPSGPPEDGGEETGDGGAEPDAPEQAPTGEDQQPAGGQEQPERRRTPQPPDAGDTPSGGLGETVRSIVRDAPGGERAAALISAGAAPAAAEPGPVGEIGLGTAVTGVIAAAAAKEGIERSGIDERIRDELPEFPTINPIPDSPSGTGQQQQQGEVPVAPPAQDVSEIKPGQPSQDATELVPGKPGQATSELEPSPPSTGQSELEPSPPSQQTPEINPGVSFSPGVVGRGAAESTARDDTVIGEDDLLDPEGIPAQVDDRLEQIRKQLEREQDQFEFNFPPGVGQSGLRRRNREDTQSGSDTGTPGEVDTAPKTPGVGVGGGGGGETLPPVGTDPEPDPTPGPTEPPTDTDPTPDPPGVSPRGDDTGAGTADPSLPPVESPIDDKGREVTPPGSPVGTEPRVPRISPPKPPDPPTMDPPQKSPPESPPRDRSDSRDTPDAKDSPGTGSSAIDATSTPETGRVSVPGVFFGLETSTANQTESRTDPIRPGRGLGTSSDNRPRKKLFFDVFSFPGEGGRGGQARGRQADREAPVVPGFASETIRDIALLGGGGAAGDADLEAAAEPVDFLTGEVPTEEEVAGTKKQQQAIEETDDLFTLGEGGDSDGFDLI